MNGKYIFRNGDKNDLEQLSLLGLISYGQYATLFAPEHWQTMKSLLENEKTWLDLLNTSTPFVCEYESNIIGMAYLVRKGNPTDIYPADCAYIRMVAVHPDHSGKGIAKELTHRCIEHARTSGENVLMLHTSEYMNAARHIYEKAGFRLYREIPPRFGKKYWLFRMEI
jgi:ribosomal protein S18 acetylase RimI-like enzyme